MNTNLKDLVFQKEKEWKAACDLRIQVLETSCKEKDKQLTEAADKFQRLKEAFQYNIKLIADRDQELEQSDCLLKDLAVKVNTKTAEVSELKIKQDDLQTVIAREQKANKELELHYQHHLREKQAEIDSYRSTKNSEIQGERNEYASFKRKLEKQLRDFEEEIAVQKREMAAGFDEALKRREHEFRVKIDEMSSMVMTHQLKANLLAKELDLMKTAQQNTADEFKHVEGNHQALEKKLKQKDWEIQDLTLMYDTKIREMENQLEHTETMKRRAVDELQSRIQELQYNLVQCESLKKSVQEDFQHRMKKMEAEIAHSKSLKTKIEQDCQQNLQIAMDEMKTQMEKQKLELTKDASSKELEIQTLRDAEYKLNTHIQQLKTSIERYKEETNMASKREVELERSKEQLEVNWRRRCDEAEREQFQKSEVLIQQLTKARDEALATVRERDREMEEMQIFIRSLQQVKNRAYIALKKNGISLGDAFEETEENSDVHRLLKQNDSLKKVISEMRHQMEQLGYAVPENENSVLSGNSRVSQGYVQSLEKEVEDLKQSNRELKEDAEKTNIHDKTADAELRDNQLIKSHINTLNETIGTLRKEKLELSGQVKKQQARILYLEELKGKSSKEPQQKQVEIDQLQYKLAAEARRHQAETSTLKQQVNDLELQLSEARKEGDEYYRSNLEKNMEITVLGNEVSALKVNLAEKRPALNFGAQELVIQQLQDEIMNLKHQRNPSSQPESESDTMLTQLKEAIRRIASLTRDKQRLIDLGNRQRAELMKAGIELPANSARSQFETREMRVTLDKPPIEADQFLNRLNQLENLQYQLTKQELEFAQKCDPKFRKDSKDSATQDIAEILLSKQEGDSSSVRVDPKDQLRSTLSSDGGESLQDVWKILEQQSTMSLNTPRPDKQHTGPVVISNEASKATGEWLVVGKKAGLEQKHLPKKPLERPQQYQKSKIRNYNVRA